MRVFLILLLMTSLCLCTFAGDYSIRAEVGYGAYEMQALNNLQQYLIEYYRWGDIVMKQTESFPPYYFYKLCLTYHPAGQIKWGICGDYASTGGRVTYSDYSGKHTADQIVHRYAYGLHVEYEYSLSQLLSLQFYVDPLLVFSNLELKERLQIFNETQSESNTFISTSIGLMPGVALQFKQGKFFARLSTGYELDTSVTLHREDKGDALRIPTKGEIDADWSGWRLSLGIGMYF